MNKQSLTVSKHTYMAFLMLILQYWNVLCFGSDLYLLHSLCRRCHNLCIFILLVLCLWLRVRSMFGPT